MNNIRKFEDFLDKMQGLIDNAKKQVHVIVPIEDIENTFPELKESEDERIRKAIIEHFAGLHSSMYPYKGFTKKQILAWLEKQGNQTIFNTPSRETILAIWELGNDWKELTNGVISTEHGTQLDYIQKHWSESEHYLRERRKQKPTSNEQQGKSALKTIHEQKPNNKPKFNVDDWICNSACIVHIASIKDGMYYFDEGDGLDITFVNNNYHLWSIADAKNGDVLSNGKIIVIFKHFEDPSYRQHIVAYIGLDRSGDIQITDDTWRLGIDKAKPATKEQRELLFQKMHEAGYMWDSNSKQLLSLKAEPSGEQKPTEWSEEDENNLTDTCVAIRKFYHGTNGAQELIDWLKLLKQRMKGD